MIYRENDEYRLMPYLATYTQHNKQHEQHVVDKNELLSYQEMGHITELLFEEAVYTPIQLSRLQAVKHYPESDYSIVAEYVSEGKPPEPTDKKRIDFLEESIITLMMEGF